MSINDWTTYADGGALFSNPLSIVYTDILTPIVGTGSLTITQEPDIAFQSVNLVPATIPMGFLAGRIQTLIRVDDVLSNETPFSVSHAGLLCMQSVENMAQFGEFGGTGQSYGASIALGNGFSLQEVRLYKFSAGIDGSNGQLPSLDLIDSVELPFSLEQGDIVCFELLWRCDVETIADIGGAYLIVRIGQEDDFSDLTDVILHIDSDPYTTTVAEGIFAGLKNEFGSGAVMFTFDQTSLYRTSIT